MFKVIILFLMGAVFFRSLIRCMGVDGNVWWVQILVVSSHIHQGLSSILHWRPSISLSSREPPLKFAT
jgi:hypothetical protein